VKWALARRGAPIAWRVTPVVTGLAVAAVLLIGTGQAVELGGIVCCPPDCSPSVAEWWIGAHGKIVATFLPHGGTPRVNMRIACTSKTSRRRRAA